MTTTKPKAARKPRGPMTRASAGRFAQGACIVRRIEDDGEFHATIQYPLGATDAEKVEMLEGLVWNTRSTMERECRNFEKMWREALDNRLGVERQFKAALSMIATFAPSGRDEVPF